MNDDRYRLLSVIIMNEFLSAREYTTHLNVSLRNNHKEWVQNNLAKKMPYMLGETKIHLGETDKVFASEWLSEDVVIFGTKCNQLMLLDIPSGKIVDIPLLKTAIGASEDDYFSDELVSVLSPSSCGIHSIQCNPGNSKLATSGHNPNHLAVYTLPNLDPYIIGKGHKDWIFTTQWLSEGLLVTSSRDSTMALWSTEHEHYTDTVLADCVPSTLPLCKFRNTSGPNEGNSKVRDLAYNPHKVVNYVKYCRYLYYIKLLAFGCITNWCMCCHCTSVGLLYFSTDLQISIAIYC